MDSIFLWLCLLVFVLLILNYFATKDKLKRIEDIKDKLRYKFIINKNFTPTQQYTDKNYLSNSLNPFKEKNDMQVYEIAIDENRKKVCFIKLINENSKLNIFDYKDIISSEIFEDGETITKTSRKSQLGGVIVGGLALGGVGAIIGGLSGKKTSINKVKRIDLRVIVNDTGNPIYDINFLNEECEKNSIKYKKAMDKARHWHALFTVIIKQANEGNDKIIEE
jgi:hypothetical protein